jgi:hypothetical protein
MTFWEHSITQYDEKLRVGGWKQKLPKMNLKTHPGKIQFLGE